MSGASLIYCSWVRLLWLRLHWVLLLGSTGGSTVRVPEDQPPADAIHWTSPRLHEGCVLHESWNHAAHVALQRTVRLCVVCRSASAARCIYHIMPPSYQCIPKQERPTHRTFSPCPINGTNDQIRRSPPGRAGRQGVVHMSFICVVPSPVLALGGAEGRLGGAEGRVVPRVS